MTDPESRTGIFAGLRVIDCGTFVAGPAAATVMSDYGADVIHVEAPGMGDVWRYQSQRPEVPHGPDNHFWTLTSRNKRSLALDLKAEESRPVLHRLVAGADVFVTNIRKSVRSRLGIDHDQLAAVNDRLIYASLTGYGEGGPEADQLAFDSTACWGRSGLMDLVRPDPDGPPARPVTGMGDHMTSMSLFGAIMTGLYLRERNDSGAYVGTSLMQSGIWANACWIQGVLSGATVERTPPRTKSPNAFNNHYRCRDDRWVTIAMNRQQQADGLEHLFRELGCAECLNEPSFATFEQRSENAEALIALMDAAFLKRPAAEWHKIFDGHRFAFAIVTRIEDFVDDEQARVAGAIVEFPGAAGTGLTVGSPLFVGGHDKVTPTKAPDLGENSFEVLSDLGFADDEIERLSDAGVVQIGAAAPKRR